MWTVELSTRASTDLRGLPRVEQRELAAVLDALQDGRAPVRLEGGQFEMDAGRLRLKGIADQESHRIVIVSIHEADSRSSVARVVGLLRRHVVRLGRGGGSMDWFRDIGRAARTLGRAPAYTATVVGTLALGIGAATAVFSVANGVLLSPLPYGAPDRVATVWSQWTGFPKTWVSLPEYVNYANQNRSFDDLALYFGSEHTFTSPDDAEQVESAVVTPNTFEVLGVSPVVGRTFTWDEALAEAPVVMLGHDVWQRRFAAERAVVGRTVEINGAGFEVVGVLPEGFRLPEDYRNGGPSEIYFAAPVDRESAMEFPQNGGNHGYFAVGRLGDGVSPEAAQADLGTLASSLEADGIYPEEWQFRPLVLSVSDDIVGTSRASILVLLAACGLLLLIACANVATLLLSRAEARAHDLAIRGALGAGGARIARQVLLESALPALAAGALALPLSMVGIRALLAIDPTAVPRSDSVALDGTVVAFAAAVSVLTALLFGVGPALRAARTHPGGALRRTARGGVEKGRWQGRLVSIQMALTVTLLLAAGLTMRTFAAFHDVDLGFEAGEVFTAGLTVPSATYPDLPAVTGYWSTLIDELRATAGVADAAAVLKLPLASQMGDSGFRPVGYVPGPGESMAADWQYVSDRYIEIMGLPLRSGRTFDSRDRADGEVTMMINETAARRFWPDSDPIGARVDTFGGDTAVVVGVVGDLRHNGLTAEVKPRYYRSIYQLSGPGNIRRLTLTVLADGTAETVAAPVRDVVRGLDPRLPLANERTLPDVVASALAPARFSMVLLGAFGVIALLLATVGVYGVLAFAVRRRTREIGVRMALGADRGEVVSMVVREGMSMALVGVVGGTVAAFLLTRFMAGVLYGVAPQDPTTFVLAPLLLIAVAALAAWLPAARASRVPPTRALRGE